MDLNINTAFQWVSNMTILNAILSGALSIMHLKLYGLGIQGIWEMRNWAMDHHPCMYEAFNIFPTIFTNISIIANQYPLLHHDLHSCSSWYDILASVGDYKDHVIHIPSLDIDLMYNLGTVVAFSGHLLLHGVNSVEGNRYCLTYYSDSKNPFHN
ncbi:hypothetical protein J3A83DRAFT_4106819 [Scleroderma citrinum]